MANHKGKTCAVMQPTYLPWSGYFQLMAEADVFIFLDDVQFERGSWHHRNRVLVQGQAHWLTVPCLRETLGQTILETHPDPRSLWKEKHWKLLEQTYSKHPHGRSLLDVLQVCYSPESPKNLADWNIYTIETIAHALGITTPCHRASQLSCHAPRSQRLLAFCDVFSCDRYLSPQGARDYLEQDGDFNRQSHIQLEYQNFPAPQYSQKGSDTFIPYLSIIDIIANMGWQGCHQLLTPVLSGSTEV